VDITNEPEHGSPLDLKRLNDAFGSWLREGYHHSAHRGIGNLRPIDRYQLSTREYPRKRVDEETIDEFFLVTTQRTVNKDCTVSLHSTFYEVPPAYIGKRVELKFAQEHPSEVYLYDNGVRIQKCTPVDSVLNGKRAYEPQSRISDVALHSFINNRGEK
jgi:putative transposase